MNGNVAVVRLLRGRHVDLDQRVDAVNWAALEDLLRRQAGELHLHVAQARVRVKITSTDRFLQIRFGTLRRSLTLLRSLEVLYVDVVERATETVERFAGRRWIRRDVVLRAGA